MDRKALSKPLRGFVWILSLLVRLVTVGSALTGDTIADHVLGQVDLFHNMTNFGGPQALFGPQGVATDPDGHIYIADSGNNRVLGYHSIAALVSGAAADIVIGQPDFNSYQQNNGSGTAALDLPVGVAADSADNLYVSDSLNSRVLEYTAPFSTCSSFPCAGIRPHCDRRFRRVFRRAHEQ